MPTYTTPVVDSFPWGTDPLFRHFGAIKVGVTVYKDANGVWRSLPDFFEDEVLADAQVVYRGGHEYNLTQEEYDEVTGAIVDPGPGPGPDPEPPGNLAYPGVAIPGDVYPSEAE